jgi:hypothetical protein
MEHVIVERRFPESITADGVRGLESEGMSCLQTNRVRHLRTYLAAGGLQMVCEFEAPDAEAVRRANRQLGVPAERIWKSTVLQPPTGGAARSDPNLELVIVERSFPRPVRFEALQAREDAGAWCLDLHRVHFLRTYFSADRRRMVCLYEAPDAESVRRAQKQIEMPLDDVWKAELVEGTS